jgi:hypothetical protein
MRGTAAGFKIFREAPRILHELKISEAVNAISSVIAIICQSILAHACQYYSECITRLLKYRKHFRGIPANYPCKKAAF